MLKAQTRVPSAKQNLSKAWDRKVKVKANSQMPMMIQSTLALLPPKITPTASSSTCTTTRPTKPLHKISKIVCISLERTLSSKTAHRCNPSESSLLRMLRATMLASMTTTMITMPKQMRTGSRLPATLRRLCKIKFSQPLWASSRSRMVHKHSIWSLKKTSNKIDTRLSLKTNRARLNKTRRKMKMYHLKLSMRSNS